MHLLNLVWPNIFEISPHVVQAVTGAINGCRLALGPAVILSYLLQGLWHPARSVFRSALSYGQGLHPRAAGHAFSVHNLRDAVQLGMRLRSCCNSRNVLCCRKVREVYWRLFNELYVAVRQSCATLHLHATCSASLRLASTLQTPAVTIA
jgi:hypothetical protein